MRIVITKNGKTIVKELDEETADNKFDKSKSKYNQSSSYTKLPIIYSNNEELFKKYTSKNNKFLKDILKYRETFQNKRSSSVVDRNVIDSFYNRDESKVNLNELNKAKRLKISHPKINMTQAFLDKYDDFDSSFKNKVNDLHNSLNNNSTVIDQSGDKYKNNEDNKNMDSNMQQSFGNIYQNKNQSMNGTINNYYSNYGLNSSSLISNKNKKISIGNIISKNNLINLRKQISQYNKGYDDTRFPLNEENMRSYNFRSRYENKQMTEDDIDLILNYSINPDKFNIIKYFQQEKNISPQYFENLVKYDEQQMYKLNKICQLIFHRKENDSKNFNLKYYELNKDKKIDRQKGNQSIKDLQTIIKRSNSILYDYNVLKKNHGFWRKHQFQEDVMKIKEKYWDKYNVDRFLKNREKMKIKGLLNTSKNSEAILNKKLFSSQSTPDIFYKTKI